ncbi:DNA-binding protein [Alcaligenes faecalis]|uniref:DNA-binding protein n=1 Tax=Alcaligenes faecalis TaxID=511 RepID=UPI0034D6CD04
MIKAVKQRGRPGISIDDVRQAVDALQKQGRHPGPVNVRLELGHGSYSTITRYLRAIESRK